MARRNLFNGTGYFSQLSERVYESLMTRQWVKYADIKEREKKEGYKGTANALKKAFPAVCDAIREVAGAESIEKEGDLKHRRIRYVGEDPDPLGDMLRARTIKSLKKYWRFCQDSAGFFPMSWLEYFFHNCQDLLEIRSRQKHGHLPIASSLDRKLKNIEMLPLLYEYIVKQRVLSIDYKPFVGEAFTVVFHPHCLREYNGRWFLFGRAEGGDIGDGFNLALDRVVEIRELSDKDYVTATPGYYEEYFKDLVGVTRPLGEVAKDIRVRAHTLYIYRLFETKPLHPEQKTIVEFGEHADGCYGEFVIHTLLNKELIGRLLLYGDGIEVTAPDDVRAVMRETIKRMGSLYSE